MPSFFAATSSSNTELKLNTASCNVDAVPNKLGAKTLNSSAANLGAELEMSLSIPGFCNTV